MLEDNVKSYDNGLGGGLVSPETGAAMSILRKLFNVYTVQCMERVGEESVAGTVVHKSQFPASEKWWLDGTVPAFPVSADKIKIIKEPSVFYETLLEKCMSADQRITLASLYLGTGSLEKKLVSALQERLEQTGGRLHVRVLLDHTRGCRGRPNSRHMLLPLLARFKHACQVYLYHTPLLRNPWRRLIPPRYNELVGLQHMKLYLFDNTLIISGANLSHDYFSNRQDRYVVVEDCPALADFYHGLVATTCDFSLRLDEHDAEHLSEGWVFHPYRDNRQAFVAAAGEHVRRFYSQAAQRSRSLLVPPDTNTWVVALVEMGQLGVQCDSVHSQRILESVQHGSSVHLATGYFNLTNEYADAIMHRCPATCHILMAHPSANGFLGARGPAGAIPMAYRMLAAAFLRRVVFAGQVGRVHMWEYVRPGWTYHGKGLWYTRPGEHAPCLTLVGSSNMGARSVQRDLESQVAVVTTDPRLQQSLAEERDALFSRGTHFTLATAADLKAPLWLSAVVRCFSHYF
ncbi:hypothetical protein PR048_029721 [Dryococelus australis]|uniref:CDP-diacylglycerol--glycerol-3-phosphate 3-phosphatidyltransferase n=1 Tax=Dryococelus australis TaxID=614101 RepID=A0ABQ9GE70_9NEOP|nr:hypothetical protein PR048_029721 [Dryococelus australis]